MTYTENYQLNQWAKTDRIQMDDFNADNAKIDAALKANANAIAAKADSSALSAETNARTAAISQLSAEKLDKSEALRLYTGTWTGDGVNGRTLTLPCVPKLALLFAEYDSGKTPLLILIRQGGVYYLRGSNYEATTSISLSGSTLTFHSSILGNMSGSVGSYVVFA